MEIDRTDEIMFFFLPFSEKIEFSEVTSRYWRPYTPCTFQLLLCGFSKLWKWYGHLWGQAGRTLKMMIFDQILALGHILRSKQGSHSLHEKFPEMLKFCEFSRKFPENLDRNCRKKLKCSWGLGRCKEANDFGHFLCVLKDVQTTFSVKKRVKTFKYTKIFRTRTL